jgi:hypothetical protein
MRAHDARYCSASRQHQRSCWQWGAPRQIDAEAVRLSASIVAAMRLGTYGSYFVFLLNLNERLARLAHMEPVVYNNDKTI